MNNDGARLSQPWEVTVCLGWRLCEKAGCCTNNSGSSDVLIVVVVVQLYCDCVLQIIVAALDIFAALDAIFAGKFLQSQSHTYLDPCLLAHWPGRRRAGDRGQKVILYRIIKTPKLVESGASHDRRRAGSLTTVAITENTALLD